MAGGVIDQANKFPREWDGDRHPFVKREVARVGQSFVSSIMEAGAAAAFHQHVGYEACGCKGVLRRTGHVFWRTLVQRNVDGHLTLNVPFLAAKYGSAAVGLNLIAEFLHLH